MDTRKVLGRALALRANDLSLEWQRQLQERVGSDADAVFPTGARQRDIPAVIEWMARRLYDESAAPDLADQLRPLVRLRREQGRDLGELLAEFRMLGHILADALVAEIDTGLPALPAGRAARIGADLGEALLQVLSVVGALYREEELTTERLVSRKLDEYSRLLTHELIDPLSSADLASQALVALDLGQDERLREIAERVQKAVRGAARVVEGVRALTLGQEEEAAPPRKDPLPAVVRRVLAQARTASSEAGIRIDVPQELPDVEVDGARLEMVLRNLIMNALKYADPSEGESWVRVRVTLEGKTLRVEVADNGVGIPPEEQARIFDWFYQADEKNGGGHGLGLAIAREAVRQMGGEIRCESDPGEGSTFSLTLPIAPREGVAAG